MNIIPPTVGRIVWYWDDIKSKHDGEQPMAAMVVGVHSDELVNLVTYDFYGNNTGRQGVTLVQPDVDCPEFGGYCEWMPYQLGQASKAFNTTATTITPEELEALLPSVDDLPEPTFDDLVSIGEQMEKACRHVCFHSATGTAHRPKSTIAPGPERGVLLVSRPRMN